MSEAGSSATIVLHADEGVIETDYSCVVVRSCGDASLFAWVLENNPLVKVLKSEDGADDLLVQTADQWGPFSVSTRLLNDRPGDPDPEWEDVVELSVATSAGLMVTEMVDNDPQIQLLSEPGEYRLRVSGRGRSVPDDAEEEDESDEPPPKEWYLLEAWPAPRTDPVVVRLTSPWAERSANPPAPLLIPEGEAGLAASVRIGRDVDNKPGARALSGELGSVRVERTIPGTRRRLFRWCAHLMSWSHSWVEGSSWSWSGGPPLEVDDYAPGYEHWGWSHRHADQLTGEHGAIRYSFVEVDKPARAVRDWAWMVRPGDEHVAFDKRVPFLPQPTRITVTLTQSRDEAGDPWTTISIFHERLPVEWLDDMETYWAYQLSIADHAQFGIPKK